MNKRANGEGSIYKAGNRFRGSIRIDGARKYFYGKTKREVSEKLEIAKAARRQGINVAEPSQTLEQYLTGWLETSIKGRLKESTYESYALNVRRVVPRIGTIKLNALKAAHLEKCYADLREAGYSPRAVQQVHTVLRIALRKAVKRDLIPKTPTIGVTPPGAPPREMHPLTEDQIQALFASSKDDPLHALWVLLATTGLRIGEATGLRWSDVDLDRGTVSVQQTVKRVSGKFLIGEPKTARSRRTVYLAAHTVEALRAHTARWEEMKQKAGQLWLDTNLVFCTHFGGPLNPSTVRQALHRALDHAGLPRIRIHDLRHTAATYLLTRGVHPKVVQEMLGHSSMGTTTDIYSHVIPGLHRDAAGLMDALFLTE